jgi:hypothetical protein
MEPTVNSEGEKRSLHRSPGYPLFDLGRAIEKTKVIYDKERRSATSSDVIASHIGYSAAKGLGGRAVSALRQYGLIEETAGKYRISELGYTLVHFDHDSDEWLDSVADAARRPTLFRELAEAYPDGLPSDATLRGDLLKRGFNPSAIPEVITVFRDSMSLAEQGNIVHNETREMPMQVAQLTPAQPAKTQSGLPLGTQGTPAQPPRQDIFSLAEGQATIQWPATLSPESFQDLSDWIDIVKRKIGRSVKATE